MGWKSTIDITRKEAISAIIKSIFKTSSLDDISNSKLEEIMYKLNIGDDVDLPYYGYNFNIKNHEE